MHRRLIYLTVWLTANALPAHARPTLFIQRTAFTAMAEDTINQRRITTALEAFLQAKDGPDSANPYIARTTLKQDAHPFEWIKNIEASMAYQDSFFYQPVLTAVLPVHPPLPYYLIKLSWMGIGPDGAPIHRATYSLMAQMDEDRRITFQPGGLYQTRFWATEKVGNISYRSPNAVDRSVALAVDSTNTRIAALFEQTPRQITYYDCKTPQQVFQCLGFDYLPNMYFAPTGGLAQPWNNTIYAGNGGKPYTHEIVHLYSRAAFPDAHRIVDEGFATLIGGTGDQPVDSLKKPVLDYLNAHPQANLMAMFTDFEQLPGSIEFTYVISALILRDVEAQYGLAGIQEMFRTVTSEASYFHFLEEKTGVGRKEFAAYATRLLAQ